MVMVFVGAAKKAQEQGKTGLKGMLDAEMGDENMNFESIAQAFRGLSSRLDEDEVKDLLRQCTTGVLCGGKPLDRNQHFLGKIGLMFKVSVANLRHQYSDFLGGSLGPAE